MSYVNMQYSSSMLVATPSIPNYKSFKNLGESKHLKFDQVYIIR